MNSLFDLCEYGLKARECQKLRLASITPKNIILSDIKINNDLTKIGNISQIMKTKRGK